MNYPNSLISEPIVGKRLQEMTNMIDFLTAAFPWIIIGLAVIAFTVYMSSNNKK
jgi:hypothetical protein